jgi:uncharacterized membrane protein YgdD (TMEM256/DUF423 family)
MNKKTMMKMAALSGFLAVVLGAFGAHGLRPMLDEKTLHAYETGVLYQFFHTLILGVMAFSSGENKGRFFSNSALFFTSGMVCFSGSLYAIAFSRAAGFDLSWLGPITPVGGLMLMVGWLFLLIHAIKA